LDHPPIRMYRFSGEAFTEGIETNELVLAIWPGNPRAPLRRESESSTVANPRIRKEKGTDLFLTFLLASDRVFPCLDERE